MKKRIITAALAVVLAFNVLAVRPKAVAGAVAAATAIGCGAVFLMGIITGQYDDTANGIGSVLENGWEGFEKAFIGTEKTFCGQVIESNDAWIVTGYKQICATITSWVDSGEATIDNGKVSLKYSQYLELCDLVGQAAVTDSVQLITDTPYLFIKANSGLTYSLDTSITILKGDEDLPLAEAKMSFVNVYYTEDTIYFPDTFFNMTFTRYSPTDNRTWTEGRMFTIDSTLNNYTQVAYDFPGGLLDQDYREFFSTFKYSINFDPSRILVSFTPPRYSYRETSAAINKWFTFGKAPGKFEQVDNVDFSHMKMGILNVKGSYLDFLKSLQNYTVVPDVSLDDLSGVLPLDKTKDPTLEVDTDPSIVIPTDAVTVTDVPGEADQTLTQLKTNTRLDIDIPSLIASKFPFCIPFDLIRIMSVLGADPVAPVFRIPISTDMKNLEPFAGNQTIGEIPEDFEPMFEIDEELVIDLSCIPLVQPICYTVFIISFVVLLIYITPKMINH